MKYEFIYDDKYILYTYADNLNEAVDNIIVKYKFKFNVGDEEFRNIILTGTLDKSKLKLLNSTVAVHENMNINDQIEVSNEEPKRR